MREIDAIRRMLEVAGEQQDIALAEVREKIEAMQPDGSATAPQHIVGLGVGFRQCRERVLAIIDAMLDQELTWRNARG